MALILCVLVFYSHIRAGILYKFTQKYLKKPQFNRTQLMWYTYMHKKIYKEKRPTNTYSNEKPVVLLTLPLLHINKQQRRIIMPNRQPKRSLLAMTAVCGTGLVPSNL